MVYGIHYRLRFGVCGDAYNGLVIDLVNVTSDASDSQEMSLIGPNCLFKCLIVRCGTIFEHRVVDNNL